MTHFGVVTMPLLYTCESGDNYYLVFETSVLISSNIPFLDNAHTELSSMIKKQSEGKTTPLLQVF